MTRLLVGDCLQMLGEVDTGTVQMCCTSPPYYGLRDYGHAGQIGLEETPEAYVARLVDVFREVRRVLHPSGVLLLNLGDSFAANRSYQVTPTKWSGLAFGKSNASKVPAGLKPKDLIGIPWMVAFALRADGWWLRCDGIWHQPNGMPESATDRPSINHEYVFLLTKSASYFWDDFAVRTPYAASTLPQKGKAYNGKGRKDYGANGVQDPSDAKRSMVAGLETRGGANLRSVWSINTEASPLPHYAVMASEVARTCIKAGSSERGCCPHCRAPWERVVEVERNGKSLVNAPAEQHLPTLPHGLRIDPTRRLGPEVQDVRRSTGWQPTCTCPPHEPVPSLILDPFAGACTTGVVALQEGREFLGCELNPEYARLGERRMEVEGKRAWRRMKVERPREGQPALLDL